MREFAIPYSHTGYNRFFDQEGYPAVKPPWGTLNAIDLNKKININLEENLTINMRLNSFKRCLMNLIDNGLSYGKKVEIFLQD